MGNCHFCILAAISLEKIIRNASKGGKANRKIYTKNQSMKKTQVRSWIAFCRKSKRGWKPQVWEISKLCPENLNEIVLSWILYLYLFQVRKNAGSNYKWLCCECCFSLGNICDIYFQLPVLYLQLLPLCYTYSCPNCVRTYLQLPPESYSIYA